MCECSDSSFSCVQEPTSHLLKHSTNLESPTVQLSLPIVWSQLSAVSTSSCQRHFHPSTKKQKLCFGPSGTNKVIFKKRKCLSAKQWVWTMADVSKALQVTGATDLVTGVPKKQQNHEWCLCKIGASSKKQCRTWSHHLCMWWQQAARKMQHDNWESVELNLVFANFDHRNHAMESLKKPETCDVQQWRPEEMKEGQGWLRQKIVCQARSYDLWSAETNLKTMHARLLDLSMNIVLPD